MIFYAKYKFKYLIKNKEILLIFRVKLFVLFVNILRYNKLLFKYVICVLLNLNYLITNTNQIALLI